METASNLRLMCVLAHPDDESLGTGGALAQCAADGVDTYVVTATRGERGRFGDGTTSPGPEVVGRMREAELAAAAAELGVREVTMLGYPDGGLDQVDPETATAAIVEHLRRIRPHVVITFGPESHLHRFLLETREITTALDSRSIEQVHQGRRRSENLNRTVTQKFPLSSLRNARHSRNTLTLFPKSRRYLCCNRNLCHTDVNAPD